MCIRDRPWRWDPSTYLQLLAISGGRERLRHFLSQASGQPPGDAEVEALQNSKTRHYTALVAAGELALRPGVRRLLTEAAAAGVPQVIVTTSGRAAVQALLERQLPQHPQWLRFWICGEDVARKKPHPEAHQLALQRLGCDPTRALAIEDSANGVAAASAAGLPVLVTRSASSAAEPAEAFIAATAELDGLGDVQAPVAVRRGPACPGGLVTLSYLQDLLPAR